MRKVVQNEEHGGQRGAAEGTEERASSLFTGAGGKVRRLLQHDLAHRGRKAGGTSPDSEEAGGSPRGRAFGVAQGRAVDLGQAWQRRGEYHPAQRWPLHGPLYGPDCYGSEE